MLDKIAEFFGGGKYKAYLAECEKNGTQPLDKEQWLAQQPQQQSC